MDDLFREARLKIERAKKHVNDLSQLSGEFLRTKAHVVFVEHDDNATGDLLKVKATATLGADFVLVLGDALHNLRTALDYAINEIEFRTVGNRTAYTKFPVYESRDSLLAAINGGLKEKLPRQVIDCLVDVIQPYRGGRGDAIWGLHQLDIEDKHRLLIANTELNFIRGIRIEDDAGTEHLVDDWLVVPGKVAAYPVKGNRNVKVKYEGNPTYVIAFGQDLPFAGRHIIPIVHGLVEMTESVLNEIRHSYTLSTIHSLG